MYKRQPWDREQDHKSVRMNVLEEAYEVMEAIDADDAAMLKEELGDLLFQAVFHCEIEKERGRFEFNDICDDVTKKMICLLYTSLQNCLSRIV